MYSRISTGNLKAYHMSMLPDKAEWEDSFFSFGVGGHVPHRFFFPIMHLVFVLPLGLYLPIHLYILAILIGQLVDLSTCRLVDVSTCRLVDLSTCRPSAIVNNKHLYMSFICTAKIELSTCRLVDLSICRLVDLSTCRPVELVLLSTIKIRLWVRVSVWLCLWLG